MDLSLAQNNEHFTIVDTAQEPNNPSLLHWLSQESGPMGKARNLALATSIAAVQEGKTYLFTFFLSKVFHYELAKKAPWERPEICSTVRLILIMNLPKNVHIF